MKTYLLFIFLALITALLLVFAFILADNIEKTYTINYKAESKTEAFWADVTAYSEIDSCHFKDCLMSNGIPAKIGYIACPRNLIHGTIVEIDGLEYECGDRYNKDLSYRFDIFMGYGKESHEVAKVFGKQTLAVKIID